MKEILKQWGGHLIAIAVFLILTIIYFAPAVLDGKTIKQGDMEKAVGMGQSQMKQYEETAQPGEFSAWSDAMFGGMPYIAVYGSPAPKLPDYRILEQPIRLLGAANAAMILAALISFYILMCAMGVNRWLAIAGAVAYAFASYNMIIIGAGHITKAYVIAYMPITIAGMCLLFKKRYIWGGILFLLGVALSIGNNHLQVTYYLVLLCLFIYLGYMMMKIKGKDFAELGKVTGVMFLAVFLAILPNLRVLYVNWELGKTSIRGATELTTTTAQGEKISSGLDKGYAFQWSYGKSELLNMIIPNAYGGGSGGTVGTDSELYKEMKAKGLQVGKDGVQTLTYWGDKPFTSGPMYMGAVVCFLFAFGMFVVRNKMKWWLFAGAAFFTLLALGRNLDWFNDFMFHYLPLYNKFRGVEMALIIPGLVFPIIAIWGLHELMSGKLDDKLIKRSFFWSLGIVGGLSLIVWIIPALLLGFISPLDVQYQFPDWYYSALVEDRKSLASADAFRSLAFILLSAGLVYYFWKAKTKKTAMIVCSAGILFLILIDLWIVDKRYLNDTHFVNQKAHEVYKLSAADEEILKDKSSYRVLNLNNPFQETTVSYYHKSIGGYHAAKSRRYQELIDHRLSGEVNEIIKAMQQIETLDDSLLLATLAQSTSLNMLNAKYIIYNPTQPPIHNPFAYGNAWFVSQGVIVENADAEIAALNEVDLLETAIIDKRFDAELKGFNPKADTTASIVQTSYRPNRLTYTSKSQSDQLAIFSEMYYQPGWNVTIDGQPASHFRVNWLMRGLCVPAGEHEIVFEFYPQGYVTAVNISTYSSFFILILVLFASLYSLYLRKRGKKPTV